MKPLDFFVFMRAAAVTITVASDKRLFEAYACVICCLRGWIYLLSTLLLCYNECPLFGIRDFLLFLNLGDSAKICGLMWKSRLDFIFSHCLLLADIWRVMLD